MNIKNRNLSTENLNDDQLVNKILQRFPLLPKCIRRAI